MSNLLRILPIVLLTTCLMACGNDASERDAAVASAEEEIEASKAPPTPPMGKITKIENNTIWLDNNKQVPLPEIGDTSVVTVFFVQHGETQEEKTSLSLEGQARAGYLANLFENTGLLNVYVDGNSAMQSGLQTSRANTCDLSPFKPKTAPQLMNNILRDYRGRRVMVVASAEGVVKMSNLLNGGRVTTYIPGNEYDNIFVVKARDIGDSDVTLLKY